jgi:hypothetical protein
VNYLKFRIGKDFQETGKCRVHIGKPIRGYGFSGLLVRKKSLHRNSINQGYRFPHLKNCLKHTTDILCFLESWNCTKRDLSNIGARNIFSGTHLLVNLPKTNQKYFDLWTLKIWLALSSYLASEFLFRYLLSRSNNFGDATFVSPHSKTPRI